MPADDLTSIKRGRITPLHMVVVALSLLMTIGAWQFSKQQIETRTQTRFDQKRDNVVALLRARMLKYEDALWSGVATLESHGGDISYQDWRAFALTLRIDEKYPGINGIGVIHFVSEAGMPDYLAQRRAERPGFEVYPEHSNGIYMPISFIEPEDINAAAVGLDVAHEQNRRTAALASRDTAQAQITGPIVLVQDAGNTPGFLFYAPFGGDDGAAGTDSRNDVRGAVYAPFVVRKLMAGLLAKELRDVRFSIKDGSDTIYDEHSEADAQNDPEPMFADTVVVDLYGRSWVLDVRTSMGFRDENTFAQPAFILIAGLLIEVLIIAMLIMMSRANGRAIDYAHKVTETLREKSDDLESANAGLKTAQAELAEQNQVLAEQNLKIEEDHDKLQATLFESDALRREQAEFTYAVSHDLKSPANTMQLVLKELALEQEGALTEDSQEFLGLAQKTASRMSELIEDILSYSWVTNESNDFQMIDMRECLDGVLSDIAYDIEESGAKISTGKLDPVFGGKTQIRMLVQNLISNGLKFQEHGATPQIRIESQTADDGKSAIITVQDNGIGVAPEHYDRIFGLFQRLHVRETYPGTGLGLATCSRIARNHHGEISVSSALGQGSTFRVRLPIRTTVARDAVEGNAP